MLELYHFAPSTCSQKVRLALAEKGLDYTSRDVDLLGGGQHASEYVKLNPGHVVPTLVHDGRVLVESTLINEYLDDAFPEPPLRPADPAGRHAMRLWTKRIDALHPSAPVVSFGIGMRATIQAQSPEAIEASIAAIPDPMRRAERRSVIERGVEAPEMVAALAAFVGVLDAMQSDLEARTWLAGDDFSQADCAALPYVMRLDHLAMTPLIEARPGVADWYARVQARDSFDRAVRALLPAPLLETIRKSGEAAWGDVQKVLRSV